MGHVDCGADDDRSASKNGSIGISCAYIDESAFLGKPFLVEKQRGDAVYGVSVNQIQ